MDAGGRQQIMSLDRSRLPGRARHHRKNAIEDHTANVRSVMEETLQVRKLNAQSLKANTSHGRATHAVGQSQPLIATQLSVALGFTGYVFGTEWNSIRHRHVRELTPAFHAELDLNLKRLPRPQRIDRAALCPQFPEYMKLTDRHPAANGEKQPFAEKPKEQRQTEHGKGRKTAQHAKRRDGEHDYQKPPAARREHEEWSSRELKWCANPFAARAPC